MEELHTDVNDDIEELEESEVNDESDDELEEQEDSNELAEKIEIKRKKRENRKKKNESEEKKEKNEMAFIYSILQNDQAYSLFKSNKESKTKNIQIDKSVTIRANGKTEVTSEQLDMLQNIKQFQNHVKFGFLSINKQNASDKVDPSSKVTVGELKEAISKLPSVDPDSVKITVSKQSM